jgi:hypothetical protein
VNQRRNLLERKFGLLNRLQDPQGTILFRGQDLRSHTVSGFFLPREEIGKRSANINANTPHEFPFISRIDSF